MLKVVMVAVAAMLAGCANMTEYYASVGQTNSLKVEMVKAQALADAARYQALTDIAASADGSTKAAIAVALAMGKSDMDRISTVTPAVPQNEALQWASILVPSVTQGYGIWANMKQNINSSNNARDISISTNGTFEHFASEINSPTIVRPEVVVVQPEVVKPEVVKPEVVDPVVVPPVVTP